MIFWIYHNRMILGYIILNIFYRYFILFYYSKLSRKFRTYPQISPINRPMVFIQKFLSLLCTRVWEREKVGNWEIISNNQLQRMSVDK
jgi:hypothetical protein